MIEIVLGIWGACFILSCLVCGVHILIVKNHLTSPKLGILNNNLKKINLYWSYTNCNFEEFKPDAQEHDHQKALRQALLIGLLGLFSLPGFVILLATVASMHFLARPRKERAVFRSELSTNQELSTERIKALAEEISQII